MAVVARHAIGVRSRPCSMIARSCSARLLGKRRGLPQHSCAGAEMGHHPQPVALLLIVGPDHLLSDPGFFLRFQQDRFMTLPIVRPISGRGFDRDRLRASSLCWVVEMAPIHPRVGFIGAVSQGLTAEAGLYRALVTGPLSADPWSASP